MNSNKYTLDRYEGNSAVFLKYTDETDRLHIHRSEINEGLKEGDIVCISLVDGMYKIERLVEETQRQHEKIQGLLEKLKKQNL
ncbi:DUF3006 domain-containing protein [Bacillus sp. FJAT-22090]|uniref:DUF3006 domain-containing protein n=1 Tax=Bacillus sp. FJAT-22090 TaxID=1581038 RepID=UPI0011A7706F|nr:DUF3006 domain-containing protein [Bacillus sp. FJAT-22090]